MRKSLFFVALTVSLMAAIAVSVFAVLQDQESTQVAASVINSPAAQWESTTGLTAFNESMAERPLDSASVTSASDPEYKGDGSGTKNGVKADHDGVCPYKDSQL